MIIDIDGKWRRINIDNNLFTWSFTKSNDNWYHDDEISTDNGRVEQLWTQFKSRNEQRDIIQRKMAAIINDHNDAIEDENE